MLERAHASLFLLNLYDVIQMKPNPCNRLTEFHNQCLEGRNIHTGGSKHNLNHRFTHFLIKQILLYSQIDPLEPEAKKGLQVCKHIHARTHIHMHTPHAKESPSASSHIS